MLTRSDLAGSDIYGADFTNALLDKTQQMVGLTGSSWLGAEGSVMLLATEPGPGSVASQ